MELRTKLLIGMTAVVASGADTLCYLWRRVKVALVETDIRRVDIENARQLGAAIGSSTSVPTGTLEREAREQRLLIGE